MEKLELNILQAFFYVIYIPLITSIPIALLNYFNIKNILLHALLYFPALGLVCVFGNLKYIFFPRKTKYLAIFVPMALILLCFVWVFKRH